MKKDNLINKIQNLSSVPLSDGKIEESILLFTGVFDCLIKMWSELKDEGCYFDQGEFKGARGRTQSRCPKYTPYRIRQPKKF